MTPLQLLQALHAKARPIRRSFAGETGGGPDVRVSYDHSRGTVTVIAEVPCSPRELQALLEGGEL